jgi:SAM-dependent methyltransferase
MTDDSDDYVAVNRAQWDERATAHAASPDYGVDRFVAEPDFISDVVRFDRDRLGDLAGVRGVHLQCHIGTDTVSLARLGARMAGLDFSAASLEQARSLSDRTGAEVEFVHAELYDALSVLPRRSFDLVYTGIGALCWLPDIDRWAEIVAALLAPGGRLFIREGHPMLWSLADPDDTGRVIVEYPYFARPEPIVWDEQGTYVESDVEFEHTRSIEFTHGLGEIVTALLSCGLRITSLIEHDSVPWDALPGMMTRLPHGEFQLTDRPWRLAHTYTLQAVAAD